jgi:hypothetical protein
MKEKTVKFWKANGKFYVFDGNKVSEYTQLLDALRLIFLLKEIRTHHTYTPKPLYPVYSLDPRMQLRGKRYAQNV